MKVERGDILVCIPGFINKGGGETDAGAGYIDGLMTESDRDSNSSDKLNVLWTFHKGCGVYQKAVRFATEEEVKAFNEGVRNIIDIKRKILFNISYEALDGELKKAEIEAFYETAAVSAIKDLKRVNYVISG